MRAWLVGIAIGCLVLAFCGCSAVASKKGAAVTLSLTALPAAGAIPYYFLGRPLNVPIDGGAP